MERHYKDRRIGHNRPLDTSLRSVQDISSSFSTRYNLNISRRYTDTSFGIR